jgi:hypothetical protein
LKRQIFWHFFAVLEKHQMTKLKTTEYLDIQECCLLEYAARNSLALGCAVDTFLTINLQQLGYAPTKAGAAFKKMRHQLKRLHEAQGIPFSCLWVFENSKAAGVHVHALVHRGAWCIDDYTRAVLETTNQSHAGDKIDVQAIEPDLKKSWEQHIADTVGYMCKGIEERHRDKIAYKKCARQGTIYGKRANCTGNLKQGKPAYFEIPAATPQKRPQEPPEAQLTSLS